MVLDTWLQLALLVLTHSARVCDSKVRMARVKTLHRPHHAVRVSVAVARERARGEVQRWWGVGCMHAGTYERCVVKVVVPTASEPHRGWCKRLGSCEQVGVLEVDVHKPSAVA